MIISNFRHNKPKIFFIGIGGISMSALAKYLVINGFSVSGSDRSDSFTTKYLAEIGCKIYIGHNEKNIVDSDIIIYNSAIDDDNSELKNAIKLNKCIIKRIELLQMIANSFKSSVGIAGSHGKTTATSIFSNILYNSEIGFTSHIGGFDNNLGNLYQTGKEIFVTEVCEFDKNITKLTVNLGLVLNIDNDHMNCYKDFNELKKVFFDFLDRSLISIVNIDDKSLLEYSYKNKYAITFSVKDKSADYFAKVLSTKNGLLVRFYEKGKKLLDAKINSNCQINVYNALSAVCLSRILEMPIKPILEGLKTFSGVKRRNELIGNLNGCNIICDYAHHPKEIENILKSYKNSSPVVIFQPHTYSRTKFLFDEFIDVLSTVENLILYKTYSAREKENCGYNEKELANKLNCLSIEDFSNLFKKIVELSKKNKVILILGAGDLYDLIVEKLKST